MAQALEEHHANIELIFMSHRGTATSTLQLQGGGGAGGPSSYAYRHSGRGILFKPCPQ